MANIRFVLDGKTPAGKGGMQTSDDVIAWRFPAGTILGRGR